MEYLYWCTKSNHFFHRKEKDCEKRLQQVFRFNN